MQGARRHADLGRVEPVGQRLLQRLGPGQFAGQAVADPDRERGRRCLALAGHVEMGIEGRDLVDLGLGQPHLVGQRRDMGRREMAVGVLDQVQEFDQQIAAARPVAQKRADLGLCRVIHLPALGRAPALAGALLFPDAFLIVEWCHGILRVRPMLHSENHIVKFGFPIA